MGSKKQIKYLILLGFWLVGCSSPPQPIPTNDIPLTQSPTSDAAPAPTRTSRPIPTLYPTPTQPPTNTPRPTITPQPTVPTPTSLPFDTQLLSIQFAIPSLGLDWQLAANVGGQITLRDGLTGMETSQTNQGNVLTEMQTLLRQLELAEMPAECDRCVYFAYQMPLDDLAGEGWLQDVQTLASFENYFAGILAPHFPPNTVLGLRKGASGYDVAQTIAIDADGLMWRWLATADQAAEPVAAGLDVEAAIADLAVVGQGTSYLAPCINRGFDTLLIQIEGEATSFGLRCSEMSLPTTLLPIYQQLDTLLMGLESAARLPLPAYPLPFDALLFYKRGDGHGLTLFNDDRYLLTSPSAGALTRTLTATTSISLTLPFQNNPSLSGDGAALLPALPSSENPEPEQFQTANLIGVRDDSGVRAIGWIETPPPGVGLLLVDLDGLINAGIPDLEALFPVTDSLEITAATTITSALPITGSDP